MLACALIVQGFSGASLARSMAAPALAVDASASDPMASLCLHDDPGEAPRPSSPHDQDRSGHDLCCTLICGLGCLTGSALLPDLAALPPPVRGEAEHRIVIDHSVVSAPAWLPVGARAPPAAT
jgi:hypothetical protein